MASTKKDDLKALEEKEKALEARELELEEKEKALEAREKVLEDIGQGQHPTGGKPKKKVKYICVKKCYHYVNVRKKTTCKIFKPNDFYFAEEGEKVPETFEMAPDKEAEEEIMARVAASENAEHPHRLGTKIKESPIEGLG